MIKKINKKEYENLNLIYIKGKNLNADRKINKRESSYCGKIMLREIIW